MFIWLCSLTIGVAHDIPPLPHEFHMSRCDIDYNPDESTLQISLSMFIDDLELTLLHLGHDSLKICTSREAPQAEALIYNYIKDHLIIEIDGSPVQLHWVGKEISEDLAAVWSYVEIRQARPKESIVISNDLLMSSFDDQQNIVKLTMAMDKKSFFLFDSQEHVGKIQL